MLPSIIKFALEEITGNVIHIDIAANGLACNCICAKCGDQMIAVQGKSENHREWHFRHHNIDTSCAGGQETAFHKFAKQVIIRSSEILLPSGVLVYSNPREETKFNSIIPDVTVSSNGPTIYIEIVVTNPVSAAKEVFYKTGQHKSIEINLSCISYDTPLQDLKEIILKQTENKRFIFWDLVQIKTSPRKKNIIPWWQHPILIISFLLGVLYLLYKGYNWLTNKNRK